MRRFLCASLLLLAALALAGCGSKGPLLKSAASAPAVTSSVPAAPVN